MLGRIVTAVIVIVLVAGTAWALWPRPVSVEIAAVERRDVEIAIEEEGKSRIREVFTVSAPVAGQLERLQLHAGDIVAGGETVLMKLRPAGPGLLDERSRRIAETTVQTAQAAVELAEAQVTQAQRQKGFAEASLERAIALSQRGLLSEQSLEKANLDSEVAQSALQSAEAGLLVRQRELDSASAALIEGTGGTSLTSCCIEVKAPVSGQVLQVLTESEQVVQAGTPLLSIGNPVDLEIAVEILSRDAVLLDVGAPATIEGWGGPALEAKVARIEPVAVTKVSALGIEEQRTGVVLELVSPPDLWQRLGHGFRVVARIVRWRGEDLVTVPTAALFRQGDAWAVFVVAEGKASLRRIELGERNAELAEIRQGLSEGERVILHPADTIVDGTTIATATATDGAE